MNEKNQIILHRTVLTGLYRDVLIESHTDQPAPTPNPSSHKNKEIRVIASSKTDSLPLGELNFLTAILKACKVQMQDIELVCFSAEGSYAYNKSTGAMYKKTLMFGVVPEQIELPVRFPHFQIQQFEKTIYLSAPALSEIEQNKQLKADLWQCLQKIFL